MCETDGLFSPVILRFETKRGTASDVPGAERFFIVMYEL